MMNEPTSMQRSYMNAISLNMCRNQLKRTKIDNKSRFLLRPDLYSTYNYRSPHDLILNVSIKAHLDDLGGITFLILGSSIKARLDNLGDTTLDRIN
jgi:hypothetical protein